MYQVVFPPQRVVAQLTLVLFHLATLNAGQWVFFCCSVAQHTVSKLGAHIEIFSIPVELHGSNYISSAPAKLVGLAEYPHLLQAQIEPHYHGWTHQNLIHHHSG